MTLYANQRQVTISKIQVEKGSGKERPYTLFYSDILEASARDLTGNEFKLYMYFATNQNNFKFGFSSKDVATSYGMSEEGARQAFSKLINKGYLIQLDDNKHKFMFVEQPKKTKDISSIAKIKEKQQFKINNNIYEWTFDELIENTNISIEQATQVWEEARKENV